MNSRSLVTRTLAALAAVVTINYARGEAATDYKQLGNVEVDKLSANSINTDVLTVDYATVELGAATVTTNPARSMVYSKMWSNGVYVVYTNTYAAVVSTNANVIGPDKFYGKSGIRLVASAGTYTNSLAAPGSTVTRTIPAHSQIYSALGSNGLYSVVTNVIAAQTVSYPAATIGQILTIVAATNCTISAGTTLVSGVGGLTNFTMVTGSVLGVTPISASKWKMVFSQP